MKKFVAFLIPVLLLGIFVLIMNSANFLKHSFANNDDVPAIIKEIKSDVEKGDWESAENGVDQLSKAWDIITKRVQFSAERDEIRLAKVSIARTRGYIESKNKAGSFAELNGVKEHWLDIGE